MSTRLALALIRVLRRLAPRAIRDRWTEEWRAEIEHAADQGGSRCRPMTSGIAPSAKRHTRTADHRRPSDWPMDLMALVASFIPAPSAARVDPLVVLREE